MSPPTSPTPQPTRASVPPPVAQPWTTPCWVSPVRPPDGDRASFTRLPDERLLAAHIDGETLYYLTDGLGSTVAMTNQAGETINTYRYGPYGEAEDTVEGITQPFQYAGGYHDEATGWTKFGVRYMSPELGRWTTQDPLRQLLQPVDANRYTYASNNPINLVDPSGRFGCSPLAQAGRGFFASIGFSGFAIASAIVAPNPGTIALAAVAGYGYAEAIVTNYQCHTDFLNELRS